MLKLQVHIAVITTPYNNEPLLLHFRGFLFFWVVYTNIINKATTANIKRRD